MDGRNSRIDRFLSSDRSKYEFASIRFVLRRAYLGSFVFNVSNSWPINYAVEEISRAIRRRDISFDSAGARGEGGER